MKLNTKNLYSVVKKTEEIAQITAGIAGSVAVIVTAAFYVKALLPEVIKIKRKNKKVEEPKFIVIEKQVEVEPKEEAMPEGTIEEVKHGKFFHK